MTATEILASFDPTAVADLTREERIRFFYWLRAQAIQEAQLGVQMKKMNVPPDIQQERTLLFLTMAREVFPLTQDRDSVSIEDIMNGKVPD